MGIAESLRISYWLGGTTCSGKSTAAKLIAAKYGLAVQHRDDYIKSHTERLKPELHPTLVKMAAGKRRMREGKGSAALETMTVEEFSKGTSELCREDWLLTLEDLESEPLVQPTIIEGTRLNPDCVLASLPNPRRAVWLAPSKHLLTEQLRSRDSAARWAPNADPEEALGRLVERMHARTEDLAQMALAHGGGVVRFGTEEEREGVAERVAELMGL